MFKRDVYLFVDQKMFLKVLDYVRSFEVVYLKNGNVAVRSNL